MIPGSKNTTDPYFPPACVRNDFFRTGVLGGVGEGIWVAGECEMLVDGSVVPVTFSIGPPTGEDWVVENILVGHITGAAATPIQFGVAAALVNGINFQLEQGANTNGLAVINNNADFVKIGTPIWGNVGVAAACIVATYEPRGENMLRGNLLERYNMVVNDDLTVVGSTTLWAMARAFKFRG